MFLALVVSRAPHSVHAQTYKTDLRIDIPCIGPFETFDSGFVWLDAFVELLSLLQL